MRDTAGLMPRLADDLAALVAIPSVSAPGYPEETYGPIVETHDLIAGLFKRRQRPQRRRRQGARQDQRPRPSGAGRGRGPGRGRAPPRGGAAVRRRPDGDAHIHAPNERVLPAEYHHAVDVEARFFRTFAERHVAREARRRTRPRRRPETVLAAYRVGDSPTNVITPLMAYFPLIVVFAQRYRKSAGIGTVVSMMLPYVAALAVAWTAFFVAWYAIGIPLGPGAPLR